MGSSRPIRIMENRITTTGKKYVNEDRVGEAASDADWEAK